MNNQVQVQQNFLLNPRDLSTLDIIIISKAIVNTWNQVYPVNPVHPANPANPANPGNMEMFETKKKKYIKVIIEILKQFCLNKTPDVLVNFLYETTISLNDNIIYCNNIVGGIELSFANLAAFNELNLLNLNNLMNINAINMNSKLYEATCKLFTNYFNLDSDEQELKKTKYINFLNENLRKYKISNNDVNTVNKALNAYIRMNNQNNQQNQQNPQNPQNPQNQIMNLDIISKNRIIKLLSTKFYISTPDTFDQLNNIFNNIPENINHNNNINNANNEINYPLFYDVINICIE